MSQTVFFACCTTDEKGGIYQYDITISSDNQVKAEQKNFYALKECIWLTFSPDHHFLYASTQGPGIGGVHSYKVNPDMSLTYLNSQKSGANCPCYLNCNPEATFIYCANYGEDGDSGLSELPLNKDGTVGELTKIIKHGGKGPNVERQECPHVHCSYVTSDGKYVCAVDLGIDAVKLYHIDPKIGISTENPIIIPAEPGFGPRHIVFDQKQEYAYIANELGNTVSSFHFENGKFTHIQTLSTIPDKCNVDTKVAAIRFSKDESHIFVSNRGYDSIACFSLEGNGRMKLQEIVNCNGSFPRDFNLLSDGIHLLCTNQLSNDITFFKFNQSNHNIEPINFKLNLPSPLCIAY